ncbi:MAG: hypothetical protein LKJ43_03135 [Lentilactobacillus buchneri]|jgi:hypothetical protein|uniref:hypothetical protein n=1 Tax=Lentilactobacillus parabuchneri TaxID=152331 RepID=UPI0023073DCE|nr:hypothetical protein [Lentilactobacillus parabuchneri]MCI1922598.1 hypothetical protein [Lentilactobacillus buchneri]MCI1950706.1 hypothetical protein [Lentilactobacillus buchneri]MCI2018218.1 hypothetical protein [Lentilactobacillus buchneri]MCI2027832.1 hypothetical protein [Lentilactobacillus buchneri]MDB1104720.1 hypothetical protein [Lentilactobacillus parabuchneri]
MNTEYKKLLLESLEKVHKAINEVEPVELPTLVHTEIEIITTIEKADQAAKMNEGLNNLVNEVKEALIGPTTKSQSNIDALLDELRGVGGK